MTGAVTDRFGYRYSQLGGCAFSIGSIFLQVFAHNKLMLLFGKLLNGIVSLPLLQSNFRRGGS